MTYRQFVVVRTDIAPVHQTIQAAHAGILAQAEHGHKIPGDPATRHLIILSVGGPFRLGLARTFVSMFFGVPTSSFVEDSPPYGFTAFSFFSSRPRFGIPFVKLWTVP